MAFNVLIGIGRDAAHAKAHGHKGAYRRGGVGQLFAGHLGMHAGGHNLGFGGIRTGQQQGKFFAAVAGAHVGRAGGPAHGRCHAAQAFVASLMPKVVVVAFEGVHI